IDVTDWYPTPDEMFTYFLVYHTNYLAQLKPFIGQPGAGLCFLALRQTAEPVVIECLTQFAWVNRIDGHSPWRN
ncbi:MAG: hypothetical protein KDD62_03750, partial [Bdellovibrionales bacterium]|nr:hypothetical protein [Bdellovibrionales bacterium]